MTFDYGLPADLFMLKRKVGLKRKGGARQRLGYRRFATAAEAIRFAVIDGIPMGRNFADGIGAARVERRGL